MIRLYPDQLGNTKKGEEAREAITKVIADTVTEKDGTDQIRAINSIYFEDRKTPDGVASDLYVSKRTIEKWTHNFIYNVARELGYTGSQK